MPRALFAPSRVCLVVVILAFVVLWAVHPHEFNASDSGAYAARAFAISSELDFGDAGLFSHRLGTTVPVALIYAAFGVNILTTHLWPLCAALLVIVAVWMALPDERSRITGALLCLVSVPLFESTVALYPDIIATSFMALSSLVLFKRRDLVQNPWTRRLAPALAAILLFLAFLAKESACWVLPLWIVALWFDARRADGGPIVRTFHIPVLGAALILGIAYLVFCAVVWGDPLSRFRSLEGHAGRHLWSWGAASTGQLLDRLTIGPLRLFARYHGLLIPALALAGLLAAAGPVRPWRGYVVWCVALFWLGSASLTRYEPLPLIGRMTLPALPGFLVLAAYMTSRLAMYAERSGRLPSLVPPLIVVGLAAVPFSQYVGSWSTRTRPESHAMTIVQRELGRDPAAERLLVCSDVRSPGALAFYFGYRYPPNLRVVSAGDLTRALVRPGGHMIFVHRTRSAFLQEAYGARHYDREIDALGLVPLYASGPVVLFATGGEELMRLVPADPREERRSSTSATDR